MGRKREKVCVGGAGGYKRRRALARERATETETDSQRLTDRLTQYTCVYVNVCVLKNTSQKVLRNVSHVFTSHM